MSAPSLSRDDYLTATSEAGSRLLRLADGHLDTVVPHCPGWNGAKLVTHMARVWHSVSEHIERRSQEMVPADQIPRPGDGEVIEFAGAALERVLAALADIGADEPVWSWSGQNNGAFYHRRMAHEALVHAWDAEAMHGTFSAVDGDLAADGVDELFTVVLGFTLANWDRPIPSGSLHLHRTDGEGEWLCVIDDDSLTVTREHAKGDAAVRAGGSDLLALVWERKPLTAAGVEVFGDVKVAEQWMALSR